MRLRENKILSSKMLYRRHINYFQVLEGRRKKMLRRGISIEKATCREILRKQLEMLAQDSVGSKGQSLADKSLVMNQLYRSLVYPFTLVTAFGFTYLCFNLIIKGNKLFQS